MRRRSIMVLKQGPHGTPESVSYPCPECGRWLRTDYGETHIDRTPACPRGLRAVLDFLTGVCAKGATGRGRKKVTHCRRGHELTGDNVREVEYQHSNGRTYIKRVCRACDRERKREGQS